MDLLRLDKAEPMIPMVFFVSDSRSANGYQDHEKIVKEIGDINKETTFSLHTVALRGADHELLKMVSANNRGQFCRVFDDADIAERMTGSDSE